MPRRSGILLPITSLPSPYGIGDFGSEAYRFVDWLHAAGQKVWAILPLTIPDELGSPFASVSSFAGNWLLLNPEQLVRDGLLSRRMLRRFQMQGRRIDYGRVNVKKRALIGWAWQAFRERSDETLVRDFSQYRREERSWLNDFCLFMAIKDRMGGRPWWTWPQGLRDRTPDVLRRWENTHRPEMDYFAFGQWLFHRQWTELKQYANARSVRILGDLPYYVAHDSADVWARRELFQLDPSGRLSHVSGAPPDLFFENGQVWGNPLYNWARMKKTGFRWWTSRVRRSLALYDTVRLDHFRGFVSVWKIRQGRQPRSGAWTAVPGRALFTALRRTLRRLPLIAEDLGKLSPAVHALRDVFGFPGMRIVQSGFRPDLASHHHPNNYLRNSVAYTGTHDMPTLKEWWMSHAGAPEKKKIRLHKSANDHDDVTTLIRLLLASRSATTIIPLQDILGLGRESRINTPGTSEGNWTWRVPKSALARRLAQKLLGATQRSRR